ncbi:MAG TPA: sulfatase [Candidatus Brocadiia bacterium]|nr:sulfatase [Candidatus Brocadiia bacterium]
MPSKNKPNLIFFGIDSLRADHMSCYGYRWDTTPHMDKFASKGVLFENTISPHIPTTPGYGSMLTGLDCFSTQVVALRHQGGMPDKVQTLPEILAKSGYETTCVGFRGNAGSRGFQNYLDFAGWGSWAEGRSPKAANLNAVTMPELERLAKGKKPFFLFMRHMDPHAPYLPPLPFDRMFYHGNEFDPANKSMEPVFEFKPFCDFFAAWMPPGIRDKDYVIAQYDGAVAYMDACIKQLFTAIEDLGLVENSVVVITADHGETLYDHQCWFDHHGIYDTVLHVPLIIRYPGHLPEGKRIKGYTQHKDLVPTLLELMGIPTKAKFDGHSLLRMVEGSVACYEAESYITEATWMRKHGWRTPEWKYMHALEPDFHFKPELELYNLIEDPDENNNLAQKEPKIVEMLEARMQAHIAKREKETKKPNPMFTNLNWHGHNCGPFKTSQQAYDTMHIGDPGEAARLQGKGGTGGKK